MRQRPGERRGEAMASVEDRVGQGTAQRAVRAKEREVVR